MKRILLIAAVLTSTLAFADTYVQGYTKKDGTYVQGHYKTEANSSKYDNYSSKPNINPYTGKKGTVDPYAPKQYEPKTYTYDDPYSKPAKKSRY